MALTTFRSAGADVLQPVVRLRDGLIVYPDRKYSHSAAVKLQVVTERIIRVTAAPTERFPETGSLMTVYGPANVPWTTEETGEYVLLKTSALTARMHRPTGAVSFADKDGKQLLAEKQYNGRSITPQVFEGQRSYSIRQTFQTTPDDAYYGLGQHQDGIVNHKDQQVYLFQNNTEVAVPFLLSVKRYGILWDNYSLTRVGDVRDPLPLSRLQLWSAEGAPGWLTARYANDRNQPEQIAFVRAESAIDYPYLGDTRRHIDPAFPLQSGVITWDGQIASGQEGIHRFNILYGGYIKVWLDGKLLADKWRQAWNPGTALLQLPLEKDRKYRIRIQWTPDGGESYLSVRWLGPPAERDTYSFASEAGRQLDYYFIHGNTPDEIIAGYRTLTGQAPIAPRWALGFWQSRERYKTQQELLGVVAEYRKRKIPLDNIVQDWSYWKEDDWGSQDFDPARFPDPGGMIRTLHDRYRTQFMISVWPKMYEGIPVYADFDKRGWLYKRNIADRQRDWIGQGYVSTFYDAFNPAARRGFWELLNKKLYSKGVDAWWMDASEPDILSNVSPERRKAQMMPLQAGLAAEYLNAYPLENARGIYEGQRAQSPGQRVFLLTRSGYAGSQRYAATIWSGDIASRWEDMQAQIAAGINFSLSGIPYWTMDIGGFAVEGRYMAEPMKEDDQAEWRELQTRWFQFGAFVPIFRSHGQFPFREIFHIAPQGTPAYESMVFYDNLRYRLLPYIYTLAGKAYHQQYTIMRGLVMDFPEDTAVRSIADQYMFGPSLLVNPVSRRGAAEREVYLPAGQGWYALLTGERFEGGRHVRAGAPYGRMPVFVKEGSILPVGPALQYAAERPADTLTLFVYTGRDGAFTLYEDEGVNYNYEQGAFSEIPLLWDEQTGRLTIGERKGQFPGMLRQRVIRVCWAGRGEKQALDPAAKAAAVVRYEGQKITVNKKK